MAILPFALTTCCPPAPVKSTTPEPGDGGGGRATPPVTGAKPPSGDTLDTLVEGGNTHGFTAVALYLDDADKPLGARFTHDATGFTFDYLRIETAPQGFLWVNSFPTSDMGEPHTQEHLLLGKGDRGRKLGSFEAMALAESSAFTDQWRTAYHFHTVAGHDVFWPVMENHVDALLNPDYTDEEIRREVRNFGVDKGDDGKLRLEEKGTVYNEMVRTYESPQRAVWKIAGRLTYGDTHPLALDSGGEPAAIREMTPKHIRAFHAATHHLANMGMIGAFPSSLPLANVLDETGKILGKLSGKKGKVYSEDQLPKPTAAAPGTIKLVDYPYATARNPGPMMFAWPVTRSLDETEHTLMSLFLDTFAGDESTPLYKKLIDGKTRVIDTGASGVWSWTSVDQGQPVYLGLSGVKAELMADDKVVTDVRALILAELARLAKLPDGDPELVAFIDKVKSRVIDTRRRLNKFLDTPPGFGIRGTGSGWNDHLVELNRHKGFKKSLTLRPALAAIETILAAKTNPFRDRIAKWGLLEMPYGIAGRPSPALRAQLDTERQQRIDAELARLQKQYGTKDEQSTLARYAQDYDAETKKLEESQASVELPPLVASPPLTLDDGLVYKTDAVAGVPRFTATFESMASARVAVAFNLRNTLDDDHMYLAALPTLLDGAGVIDNGAPIAADEMRERMRKEILGVSIHYAYNPRSGRLELVIAGQGNGAGETTAALAWMRRLALAPDWRIENLPRLRDLIDQSVTGLRQAMLGAEEGWVDDPRDAWKRQADLEYLHTNSFLTQAHDLHRLRWMLLDPQDAKVEKEVVAFFGELAAAKTLARADLVDLAKALSDPKPPVATGKSARWLTAASKLSEKARTLAVEAGKDLAAIVPELPDASLAADWVYLCKQMAKDLASGAKPALAKLEAVRKTIINGSAARLVVTGSTANQTAIAADLEAFLAALPKTPPRKHGMSSKLSAHPLRDRLDDHDRGATKEARFVGLVAPSTSSGVFLNQAPSPFYSDTQDDKVLDYLASNLYTGHGAHSIFMKTWAAGLAYSNGLRPRLHDGVLTYYAERCPVLPQTLRFVIDELKKAKPDSSIARYAIATAFDSRIATSFEGRASAMAANLVDGLTPEVVRAFRTKVLEVAKREDLTKELFARMQPVYAKVLPGYGALDPNGTYFVIGPEKQIAAYEDYLKSAVGKATVLHRLYPRDFWIPMKL
jgi:Zn-dependent M16 (insulinase) family peptidase